MNDKPLFKTPGEMISEAREAKDLTIAQLSERTKIPPPVLSALELDEYHKISGPLYIKSFLRTCAADLGLDPDIVLGLYNKISGEQQGGSGGADMVWDEDKVQVSRIGLPWIQIVLVAGILAVLIGVGMFTLRGCGGDEEAATAENLTEDTSPAIVAAIVDSASENRPQHESLIPAEKEAELKELAAAEPETRSEEKPSPGPIRDLAADTLSLGWILSPPEPPVDGEIESPEEEVAAAEGDGEIVSLGDSAADDSGSLAQDPEDQVAEPVLDDSPVIVEKDDPPKVTVTESSSDDAAGTVEIVTAETPTTSAPAEGLPEELPEEQPVVQPKVEPKVEDWIDSAWPLVLRVVCDAPQRIQVKRDGDREFTEVRWPAESEPAPEVPAAGFEAGRAYRQGDRLVVFWGADDHFSLILARVRGVEVVVNGRIREIANLRAGQEFVLDSHSAGSSGGR
jgi:cytoskeleton protein RodZ